MKLICLGNYPPRKCGIATFTENLVNAIMDAAKMQHLEISIDVIAMNDKGKNYPYPPIVTRSINCLNKQEYIDAAGYINQSGASALLLQHEYGIFGGESGLLLLELLRKLKIPVVTTLHSVLKEPSFHQKEVLIKIGQYSSRIIVMNPIAIEFLTKVFYILEKKIQVIEHGVPDFSQLKDVVGIIPDDWKDRKIMLTFGLLGRSKGIETVIKALPAIINKYPEVLYVVLGKTHPHVVTHSGEEYREFLEELTSQFNLQNHVSFINEYVGEEVLMQYLKRADIYVTPYLNKTQITSGTLAYAVSGGAAVISTPYWHAETLLANGRGKLFNFSDDKALTEIVIELLDNPGKMTRLRTNAYNYGTKIIWPKIGLEYYNVFVQILQAGVTVIPEMIFDSFNFSIPKFISFHLEMLTDKTGLVQHANGSVADYRTGYCTDDNTRGLIVATKAFVRFEEQKYLKLIYRYLSFIMYMQNPNGSFINYLSFCRSTDEERGSDDAFGRAVWALGYVIRYAPNDSLLQTSKELFFKTATNLDQLVYARGYANCILGLYHYIKRYPDHDNFVEMLVSLSNQLCEKVNEHSRDGWTWFEPELTYDNGLLPAALYLAYEITDIQQYFEVAEKTRHFLEKQCFKNNYLTIIGNDRWLKPDDYTHEFAQQPIDAMAMVLMYHCAHKVNYKQEIIDKLKLSFSWFLGKNELNLPLYDYQTHGCNDGLETFNVNRNQGAENVIAYLYSWLLAEPFF
ncbi:MAG: glycosyltransferase [Bacteroidetes bacterium]|nr:glycosyltransferase [Bacteroidota bacterium]MBL6944091.1 glycosyltransferase [Bacteroidales bacterium]